MRERLRQNLSTGYRLHPDLGRALEGYIAHGDRHLTRYNAVEVDLNRDHVDRIQRESRALHDKVLGARSSGYLIRQTVITLEAATRALADGSIDAADTSLWDTLPAQEWNPGE